MSYVEVLQVQENGDVTSFEKVGNGHGYAPFAWQDLATRHGFSSSRYVMGDDDGINRLWSSVGKGVLQRWEEVLLVGTFDFVWFPRELAGELADALDRFYDERAKPKNTVATTAGIARAIRRILMDPTALGIALHVCSAIASFWTYPNKETDLRPYNVLRDGEKPAGTSYAGKRATNALDELKGASDAED